MERRRAKGTARKEALAEAGAARPGAARHGLAGHSGGPQVLCGCANEVVLTRSL